MVHSSIKYSEYFFIVFVIDPNSADWASTGYGYQSCVWSAGQGSLILAPPENFALAKQVNCPSRPASAHSSSTPRINHQSGAYSRDSSRFSRRCPYLPSTAIRGFPPLGGYFDGRLVSESSSKNATLYEVRNKTIGN